MERMGTRGGKRGRVRWQKEGGGERVKTRERARGRLGEITDLIFWLKVQNQVWLLG